MDVLITRKDRPQRGYNSCCVSQQLEAVSIAEEQLEMLRACSGKAGRGPASRFAKRLCKDRS